MATLPAPVANSGFGFAPTLMGPQDHNIVAGDVNATANSTAYKIPGADNITNGLNSIGNATMPDQTAENGDNDALDSLAQAFNQIQAHGGQVSAAQRAILQDQLMNQGGGLKNNVKAGEAAIGDAGQVAQQESNAAAKNSQSATGQAFANKLQQFMTQLAISHANHVKATQSRGITDTMANQEAAAQEQLHNAAAQGGIQNQNLFTSQLGNDMTQVQNNITGTLSGGASAAAGASQLANAPSAPTASAAPAQSFTGPPISGSSAYGAQGQSGAGDFNVGISQSPNTAPTGSFQPQDLIGFG